MVFSEKLFSPEVGNPHPDLESNSHRVKSYEKLTKPCCRAGFRQLHKVIRLALLSFRLILDSV